MSRLKKAHVNVPSDSMTTIPGMTNQSLFDQYKEAGVNIPWGYADSSDEDIQKMFGFQFDALTTGDTNTPGIDRTGPGPGFPVPDPNTLPVRPPSFGPPGYKHGGAVKGTGNWKGKAVPGMKRGGVVRKK